MSTHLTKFMHMITIHSMITYSMDESIMSELMNDAQVKANVVVARSSGGDKLEIKNYYMPEYQRLMIEELASIHSMSQAAVLRQIIDEWYISKISER